MKRRASQNINPAGKRAADDNSYTASETEELSSDSATTTELLDSSSCGTSSSASSAKVEPDEKDDEYCPYIKIEEIVSLPDIPVTQISRPALLRIKECTFFSVLSTDVFALILAEVYGPPQEPLGPVDIGAPPDVSVKFLSPLQRWVQIKSVTPTQYAIGCAFDTSPHVGLIQWPQRVDFADATCVREEDFYSTAIWIGDGVHYFGTDEQFARTDEGPVQCFPTNCGTKFYLLSYDEFSLKAFPDNTIARYETSPMFHYTCGVVFSSNCVGLVRSCLGLVHQLEYFSPLLDVHTEYQICDGLVDIVSCCCDSGDNLYVFGTSADLCGFISAYSFAAEKCTMLNRISLGIAVGFCLTPKGDLVVAREACMDLYKKK